MEAAIMPVDKGLYLPCILDDNANIIYCWGFPVNAETAKKRAAAELELREWLRDRPEEERTCLGKKSSG